MIGKWFSQIENKYTDVKVEKYVIMPNHILCITFLFNKRLWQRSNYEHIIRDEDDYIAKWNYIDTNLEKWIDNEYYIGY
mgnify:CR=1 FL=1